MGVHINYRSNLHTFQVSIWNSKKWKEARDPEKVVEITLKVENLVKLLKNSYIIRLVQLFSKEWVDN